MALINRVKVTLSGFQGGPGMSTFYCLNPVTFLPLLRAFYETVKFDIPGVVTVNFPSSGDIIESVTGALSGSWAATPPPPVVGLNTGAYSAPVGLVVNWNTNSIVNGHRVIGRTFMVPWGGNAFASDGTPNSVSQNGLLAAAQTLVTGAAANFVVWSRPRAAAPSPPVRAPIVARAGGHVPVNGAAVPDLAAVLTSRRD